MGGAGGGRRAPPLPPPQLRRPGHPPRTWCRLPGRVRPRGPGLLMRNLTPLRASVVTRAIFVAWHVVVQVQTLSVTNFASPWQIVPAMGVAFAGLFAGGVIFAFLRLRTRNVAGAVMAHWLFDAGLVTGLFFLSRSRRPTQP